MSDKILINIFLVYRLNFFLLIKFYLNRILFLIPFFLEHYFNLL